MARRVNPHDIRRGAVLLAEPYMIDPNFKRSVILLTDHSQADGNIHDVGDILDESVKITPGMYWGGSFEKLKFLISNGLVKPRNIKFFLGYSGWTAGQLMDEMQYGSWITAHMDINYAFKTKHHKMWSEVMRNKGGNYHVIGEMPDYSWLN